MGLSEDAEFGRPRFPQSDDFGEFGKPRFSFGDRLLDAAGSRGPRPGAGRDHEPPSPRGMEDPFEDPFFGGRAGKRLGREGNLTADSDFLNEDPFKSRARRGFESSAADELMDDMRRDAESSASKFRSKLRTKRAQEDSAAEFGSGHDGHGEESTEARIERIRARAKARIAEAMEDDFPPPAAAMSKSYFGEDFDSAPAVSSGGSKSVRISKRSLKTTFDTD